MAKIDMTLKRIFAWAVLISILLVGVVCYLHFASQQRQAEREVIYIKARAMVAQQQRERTQQWEKRRREQAMQREYSKGRVVDLSQSAQATSSQQPAAQ